ncbi:MAG TPA: carboxyl transferase domain-containing protein, partial [Actinomycetota bacterium]|nr:carboxyl transferase domain-containing protein [Actinomycetota bacterium]
MSCEHRDPDRWNVCRACGHHAWLPPAARIRLIARDFVERDARLRGRDPLGFPGYPGSVERARERTGAVEAVVAGEGSVDGVRCALVVGDFAFLGGSMGAAVGEKVARAYDRARRSRLPVVVVTSSGGARMQEGMVSLVQMPKTVEARRLHAEAGLGQVSVLASPTTGGVYASFGSLADVILAEPGATVGFAGPRVVSDLTGSAPPPDVHTAEHAHAHGLVDLIVPRGVQRRTLGTVLRSLTAAAAKPRPVAPTRPARPGRLGAWERLQLARHPDRPTGPEVARGILTDAFELRGDRSGSDDEAVRVLMGALRTTGARVVVIAQDASTPRGMRPGGYRKVRRAVRAAGRLGLPVVTVIGTRGADPLPDSEAAGIAGAIARTFETLLACPSPSVAVVWGEGGSGGALALGACDRLVAMENSVFSVIAPEGAA